MWVWLVVGYAVVGAVLICCAGSVALFVADEKHRELAYRVLKLVLATATGGVVVLMIRCAAAGAGS